MLPRNCKWYGRRCSINAQIVSAKRQSDGNGVVWQPIRYGHHPKKAVGHDSVSGSIILPTKTGRERSAKDGQKTPNVVLT